MDNYTTRALLSIYCNYILWRIWRFSYNTLRLWRIMSFNQLTCVSLFSGGGGLDLGLEAAGFSTKYATDIDFHSCQTLNNGKLISKQLNKPFLQEAIIEQQDILDLNGSDILKALNFKPRQLDLLAGGPPCQAFSIFGKRQGRSDPRGQLVDHYLRLLEELEPKAFLFENVFGLMTIDGGKILEQLLEKLSEPKKGLKYKVSFLRLNAVNYGVPQNRDRVFIIGHLDGGEIDSVPILTSKEESPLSTSLPLRTVRDALRDLPGIGESNLANHTGRVHSQRIIDRYASLKPRERDPKTRINKLDLDSPSFTIIVGSDAGGGKGHVHPIEPREVTPRESARIQTFPDWWSFSGTSRHPIRQIGNAVPPLLGAMIGNEIRHKLFCRNKVSLDEICNVLDLQHLQLCLVDSSELKKRAVA